MQKYNEVATANQRDYKRKLQLLPREAKGLQGERKGFQRELKGSTNGFKGINKTPLLKLRICQNSKPKCKTQGFQVFMRHRPSFSWHLNTDFLCVLCLQLRPPKTTQISAPPLPPGGGTPLLVVMFTVSFFGTLSKCSFGVFGGHIGLQYCQKWVQNDVILRSDSCLVHLLEIALPPRREHHFHCFERSANHLFLNTFLKAYFGASI